MLGDFRPGRRAMASFGLITLLICSKSLASDNIWTSTYGQGWFYEVRSGWGQVLAGSWWESSLSPGKSYRISFQVNKLQGRIGLLLGNNPAISIDKPGTYSYDFNVSEDGKRRLLFKTMSGEVLASVSRIEVKQAWASTAATSEGGGNWIPKGHYLSFARERNLKREVLDIMDNPWTAPSDYARDQAEMLDRAFRTPGVKGLWTSVDWGTVEVGDGKYNWNLIDANMDVARRYGLKLLVKIGDRSFDGSNILPNYFPSQYALWTTGSGKKGFVSKRWSPFVYTRLIRLYKAIASRYASDPAFGGIATSESAIGNVAAGANYSVAKYRDALIQIATQTQAFMPRGKLFFYLNFIQNGDSADMRKDVRAAILRNIPHGPIVVGGPDTTPDAQGMPPSVTAYRLHARRTMPGLSQFCHMQHVDQGLNGVNVKSNQSRKAYLNHVANVREQEGKWWFSGKPAIFEFDDLRNPAGQKVKLHPNWVLNKLWEPQELLHYGVRNFGCDYAIWHVREHAKWNEFGWKDVRTVILNNQYFYN